MGCEDDAIKPCFIAAGKALTYGNLRRQRADSLENKPFPVLSEVLQAHCFFEFGGIEDHFKYRDAVMRAYPQGHFPVFEQMNHMQPISPPVKTTRHAMTHSAVRSVSL